MDLLSEFRAIAEAKTRVIGLVRNGRVSSQAVHEALRSASRFAPTTPCRRHYGATCGGERRHGRKPVQADWSRDSHKSGKSAVNV